MTLKALCYPQCFYTACPFCRVSDNGSFIPCRASVCRYSLESQEGSAPWTASRDIQISLSVISRVLLGSFDKKRQCEIRGSHSGLSKHSFAGCDAGSRRTVSPATRRRSSQYLCLPEGRNWRKPCLPNEYGPTSAFARVICGLHSVKAILISGTWININWFLNVLILIRHSDLCTGYTKVLFPIVRLTSCIKRASLVAFDYYYYYYYYYCGPG